jgi:hypothetical protein
MKQEVREVMCPPISSLTSCFINPYEKISQTSIF